MARRLLLSAVDVLVVAWVAAWGAAGFVVYEHLGRLRQLGDSAEQAASALEATAEGLRPLDGLPVVGGDIDRMATEVERTAAETHLSARRSREAVDTVAPVVGAAVAASVAVPTTVAYLPARTRSARRRKEGGA